MITDTEPKRKPTPQEAWRLRHPQATWAHSATRSAKGCEGLGVTSPSGTSLVWAKATQTGVPVPRVGASGISGVAGLGVTLGCG